MDDDRNATSEALEKTYYAGMVSKNGTLFIEGIGSRSNNWGVRATLSVKGIASHAAREAVEKFVRVRNGDKRNRHGTSVVIHLTTLAEVQELGEKLGIGAEVDLAIGEIYRLDEETGRKGEYYDLRREGLKLDKEGANRTHIVLATLKDRMFEKSVAAAGCLLLGTLALNAFTEGQRGLSLGAEDLAALAAGRGILERYGKASTPKVA